MRIGFIKLGLKTYFKKNGSGEGSNHELVDTYKIFLERGHECYMLSNSDFAEATTMNVFPLDWIFVFNGFAPSGWETNMNMLKGSLESLKFLRDHKDIPYAYFWTDPRYNIDKNPIFKEVPPKVILSQEPENYAHLDKLILYQKNAPLPFEKKVLFGILMNDTKETKRKKALLDCINWLNQEKIMPDIRGKWPGMGFSIDEDKVLDYLATVKYSFNCGKNPKWVSQKYWEMALNGVMCFYTNYDEDCLILGYSDERRVKDGIDIVNRVQAYEDNPDVFQGLLNNVKKELKADYFTGDFVYKAIMEKLK